MNKEKRQSEIKAYGFTVYARIKEIEQVMDLLVCECECEPEPQTTTVIESRWYL